ncbi:MAG: Ribonuclease BN [Chloroflexi bacterium]|nr:Ribonuclease BN [Chloroflexota bacterium]
MSKVIVLGSASAVPYEDHENTHLVFMGKEHTILVDCVGSPVTRLRLAGLGINDVTDLILTHFHPDHVSGVPLLLMNMWLVGREKQLDIYGLHHTLTRMEKLMGFYDWGSWPNFFPVIFHRLPSETMTVALDNEEFLIHTAPVKHLIPTIGLRVGFCKEDFVVAYSCDTEPCPDVVSLASRANVLIHEATGNTRGHSSAAQAGEIAHRSEVDTLCLIHYSLNEKGPEDLIAEAQKNFSGQVILAHDLMEIGAK